jgi:hypothetical protein
MQHCAAARLRRACLAQQLSAPAHRSRARACPPPRTALHPCSAAGIAAGGITAETPVWREGRSGWDALKAVAELSSLLQAAPSAGATPAPAATAAAGTSAATNGAPRWVF